MDFNKYFTEAFKNPNFEGLSYFNKVDLYNHDKNSIQVSVPPSVSENESLYMGELFEMLRNQISTEVQKKILSHIHTIGLDNPYFIDVINAMNPPANTLFSDASGDLIREFTTQLLRISTKNIVSNGRITSSYIMDSPFFSPEPFSNKLSVYKTFTKQGSLSGNIMVYIDSFMRWDDDFILTYDNIYYDIKNLNLEITRDSRFAPILKVNFDFAFKVDNPGIIWVIENLNSKGFSYYRSTLRDKKIDYLLN